MSVELFLGDCLEVMKTLPDESIDAVITDPPWMDYQTGRYDASAWHKPIIALEPILYAPMLYRVTRDAGAILLWCRWDCFHNHATALAEAGFIIKNCIVWDKGNHTAGDLNGNFGNRHEMAVFAVKGRWVNSGKRDHNLWQESHLFSKVKRYHPTQKPVNLMRRAVETLCFGNATVLDPFMGSGTTGVACVQAGRNFIGIEILEEYFRIAKKRIEEAQMQLPLFQIENA